VARAAGTAGILEDLVLILAPARASILEDRECTVAVGLGVAVRIITDVAHNLVR